MVQVATACCRIFLDIGSETSSYPGKLRIDSSLEHTVFVSLCLTILFIMLKNDQG